MFFKVTKKEVKKHYTHIFFIPYCEWKYALQGFDSIVYVSDSNGYTCNIYDGLQFGFGGVAIATGLSRFGTECDDRDVLNLETECRLMFPDCKATRANMVSQFILKQLEKTPEWKKA